MNYREFTVKAWHQIPKEYCSVLSKVTQSEQEVQKWKSGKVSQGPNPYCSKEYYIAFCQKLHKVSKKCKSRKVEKWKSGTVTLAEKVPADIGFGGGVRSGSLRLAEKVPADIRFRAARKLRLAPVIMEFL